jgi:hypothetical protein
MDVAISPDSLRSHWTFPLKRRWMHQNDEGDNSSLIRCNKEYGAMASTMRESRLL